MHPLLSPLHPSTPTPPHPLTAVRPLLPLFGLCCLCSSSSFSRERTCRNANNNGPSAASHTYVHTYIQTDRQTERGAQCLHVSSHRLLVLGLLCLLHTHTHNEDHDTHQVGSMSSQPKATPLSHSHTKQHTEGGRVQLPQHHVQFLLSPLSPPSYPSSSLSPLCPHPLTLSLLAGFMGYIGRTNLLCEPTAEASGALE